MSGSNQNLVSNLVFWNVDRDFGWDRTSKKFTWNWSIRQTNQHGNLIDHKLHYNYPILPKNEPKISIFHFNQNLTNCFIARIYSEFSKFCENFAKIKIFHQKRDGPHSAGYSDNSSRSFLSFETFSITGSAGYFLFSSSVDIDGVPFEHISIRFIINLCLDNSDVILCPPSFHNQGYPDFNM